MDAREEMQRWIATVLSNAAEEDAKLIKSDIDLFLGVAGQLAGVLSSRYETLARKYRPNRSKPPKLAPAKPLQQPKSPDSSHDSSDPEMDAQDAKKRPERMSRIQQGIQKAQPGPKSQQQALRRQIYGPQNKDVAFQKAAKKLAG